MAQVLQRPLDARVAPPRILRGHPQNEGRDLPHDPRPAWPPRREGPLPGDQAAVPSEDRVGRHDGRDLPQDPSAESASPRREAPALVIGQPEAAPLQLLLQDAVLLYQVLDNVLLVTMTHPARVRSNTCKGEKVAFIGRSYPEWGTSKDPAEFSDTTTPGDGRVSL